MQLPYPFTRGVKTLLIATGGIFLVQLLPATGPWLLAHCALSPVETFGHGQLWRLGTYMFLHSTRDFSHLALNALALWMFGGELEELWGTRKFIVHYVLFGVGAGFFGALYLFHPAMRYIPIIGASGAIFGLLTAYAVYYPHREILLFFILPVKAWMLVAGYAALSLLLSFSQGTAVAHLVHLGGIAAAFAYLNAAPRVDVWYRGIRELRDEKNMRRRAEQAAMRKRFFAERVDPILEKIALQGMGSLTKEEKKILSQAGASARERLKERKIVPFDLFKKLR
jgi:membrane associated rhomboid family serine protease